MKGIKGYRSRNSDQVTTKHIRKYSADSNTINLGDNLFESPNIVHIELGTPLDLDSEREKKQNQNDLNIIEMKTNNDNKDNNSILAMPMSQVSSYEPSESPTPTIMDNINDINIEKYEDKPAIFEWKLQGSKLELFKNCKHEESIKSKEFNILNLNTNSIHKNNKIINEIIWQLECYSNGYFGDDINKIKLYLTSNKLPSNISKILVCFELLCVETDTRYVGCDEFTYNQCQCQWNDNMLTLDKILHLNKLTFKVWINILQIHYINDIRIGGKSKESHIKLYEKLTFQWNINQIGIESCKQSSIGQIFCSGNYCNFWFQLMPNGYTNDNKGKIKLYLQYIGILPSGLRCIKLKYKILSKYNKFNRVEIIKIKKKNKYSTIANFNF
eukprot:243168_1